MNKSSVVNRQSSIPSSPLPVRIESHFGFGGQGVKILLTDRESKPIIDLGASMFVEGVDIQIRQGAANRAQIKLLAPHLTIEAEGEIELTTFNGRRFRLVAIEECNEQPEEGST